MREGREGPWFTWVWVIGCGMHIRNIFKWTYRVYKVIYRCIFEGTVGVASLSARDRV